MTLPAGRTLVSTLTPNASSDYDLYVYNSNGTLIGSSENGTGATDAVSRHQHRQQRVHALHPRGALERRHGCDQRQVHAEPELVASMTAGPV